MCQYIFTYLHLYRLKFLNVCKSLHLYTNTHIRQQAQHTLERKVLHMNGREERGKERDRESKREEREKHERESKRGSERKGERGKRGEIAPENELLVMGVRATKREMVKCESERKRMQNGRKK